jgi:hypothetical protein
LGQRSDIRGLIISQMRRQFQERNGEALFFKVLGLTLPSGYDILSLEILNEEMKSMHYANKLSSSSSLPRAGYDVLHRGRSVSIHR